MNMKYGIKKTEEGYITELLRAGDEPKEYEMYVASEVVSTAGARYTIVNEHLEDVIEAKRWSYHANYVWGCLYHLPGDNIHVTLRRRDENVMFQIVDDNDASSEFVNIMMQIVETCQTMDDVKSLLTRNKYCIRCEEPWWEQKNAKQDNKSEISCSLFQEDACTASKKFSTDDDLPF